MATCVTEDLNLEEKVQIAVNRLGYGSLKPLQKEAVMGRSGPAETMACIHSHEVAVEL